MFIRELDSSTLRVPSVDKILKGAPTAPGKNLAHIEMKEYFGEVRETPPARMKPRG
jgi:hypothetical protein